MIERYPLTWPAGWKRTVNRERARFARETHSLINGSYQRTGKRELSVSEANERVLKELRAMYVGDSVVSTNLVLTSFGTPRSGQREPQDPGVAVYWEKRGKPQCMAIDQYDRVADNLAAIAASLAALRAIERHGGAQIMERAFIGFAALPASAGRTWREVLKFNGVTPTKPMVEDRFRELAKDAHPDKGGTTEIFTELTRAREEALREI